jgi:hypothetical protein
MNMKDGNKMTLQRNQAPAPDVVHQTSHKHYIMGVLGSRTPKVRLMVWDIIVQHEQFIGLSRERAVPWALKRHEGRGECSYVGVESIAFGDQLGKECDWSHVHVLDLNHQHQPP